MNRWIELKVKIAETEYGARETVEILDSSEDIDKEFLDMLWEDWDIYISDEYWENYLKRKKKEGDVNEN